MTRVLRAALPSRVSQTIVLAVCVFTLARCGGDSTSPKKVIDLPTTAVTIDAEEGQPEPTTQELAITTSSASLDGLAVTVTYPSSGPSGWLTAGVSSAATPSNLTLHANTSSLTAGTYTATVKITGTGAATRSIPVTVKVAKLYGNVTYDSSTPYGVNAFYAYPVEVTTASTLVSVAVGVASGSANVKVGIYAMNGAGAPTTLVASGTAAVVAGRNDIPITAALPAGGYFVGIVADAQFNIRYATASAVNYAFFSHPFANALPATFPTPGSMTAGGFNVFLKVSVP